MNRLFEAALDGVAFSGIAEELLLLDIREEAPRMDTVTSAMALRPGMLRTRNVRQSLSVTLRYMVRTQDVARRAAVHDLVTAWARKGGLLTINARPGKQLAVVLDTPPALGSSLQWTDEVSLTLTAYAWPYWQSDPLPYIVGALALDESSGSYTMSSVLPLSGTVDACFSAMIAVQEGTLNTLRVQVGASFFQLDGLAADETVIVGYQDDGLLHITRMGADGAASLLHCRSADSSDDLTAAPGDVQITVEADAPCTVRITAKEMWV